MKIDDAFEMIKTRQILTSRGEPTVEVDLHTELGVFRSSCPSGASTGSKEAKAIIDNKEDEYCGKGVKKALFHIDDLITPRIMDIRDTKIYDQTNIDKFFIGIDGTENKSRIGANAILPLSMSFCRAGAVAKNLSVREFIAKLSKSESGMPIPYFNVINGGVHSGNDLPFQEIMISFHTESYEKNLEYGVIVYQKLKKVIANKYGTHATSVGDEGGFAPPIADLKEGIDLIIEAYKQTDIADIKIAIDCAASEFYSDSCYDLGFKSKKTDQKITGKELMNYYNDLLDQYPEIHMLEDPFAENDYDSWQEFMKATEKRNVNIVGDDLTVTNVNHIKTAAEKKLCNTLLVKLNQIGTVSEAIEAVQLARSKNMKIMVSHRSGETEDTFICDFACGIGADYIKAGAPCRGERVAKYNQLLRIHEVIKKKKK